MRKLITKDIFALSRIIKKMDIKKEISEVAQDVTGYSSEEKIKAEAAMQTSLIMIFVENIGSAEVEIYKFLSDVTGSEVKEIEDMNLTAFMALIKELFSQEGIGDFLPSALK